MKKIGTINEIKDSIHKNDFRIKKYFGQNFLVDQNILARIVLDAGITKETNVIEIGPGLGSLTQKLLDSANHVLAYEIDKDLIPILKKEFVDYKNFTLIQNDILKVDIDEEITQLFHDDLDIVVVSNLPYYITTPILMKFLETSKKVKKMIFMVQYEVAKRITSKPNTKDYNALSIVIQYRASASILFNVPKTVFIPEPSVDSAVIAVEVKENILHQADNEEFFFRFVHNCFTQRRKTLANNLLSTYPTLNREKIEQLLNGEHINVQIRSEALSVDQMIDLSNQLIHLL